MNITLDGNAVNKMTFRNLDAVVYLEEIGSGKDPIEKIVSTDYYVSHHAFPKRYSLDVNNPIPTGNCLTNCF